MRVRSATAIQISGVRTPSMSRVTRDCFTGGSVSEEAACVEKVTGFGPRITLPRRSDRMLVENVRVRLRGRVVLIGQRLGYWGGLVGGVRGLERGGIKFDGFGSAFYLGGSEMVKGDTMADGAGGAFGEENG